MRVTGSMQSMQLMNNLQKINQSLTQGQNQLATGQKITKPSDDPIGLGYQMRYDTDLARSDEFLSNTQTGGEILSTMDSLLQQSNDVLKRARTLALQASNGTYSAEQRLTISAEIKQLKEQLVTIGNSKYNGNYLFNGQKSDQAPYTTNGAATDSTDPGVLYLYVSPAVKVPVSITGEEIFGGAGTNNAFKVLDDLAAALDSNNAAGISDSLNGIDTVADKLSIAWAEIGARSNRFSLMETRITNEQVSLKEMRANVAEVDVAQAITDLKSKELVLQSALSTGARIMQSSLLNFLN
ncbi:flagellar hook-associated protein FlgL [Paenibacillus sp. FSL H7-0714]|uniref:flagellar hook-associated protein FlgL n=1 Tax=Paenibacillus sp. FSL H7-0714 TaxID=2954735 RepID=UPI0030FAFB31